MENNQNINYYVEGFKNNIKSSWGKCHIFNLRYLGNHIISFNLNYFKQFEISQIQKLLFSPIFIFEEINNVKSLIFWKILVLFFPNFGRFHHDHPQVYHRKHFFSIFIV